jgi:hypothetical protein
MVNGRRGSLPTGCRALSASLPSPISWSTTTCRSGLSNRSSGPASGCLGWRLHPPIFPVSQQSVSVRTRPRRRRSRFSSSKCALGTIRRGLPGRQQAARRPDLVPLLTDLFYSTSDASVRSACVVGLMELAEEGTSPAPLFDALSDASPDVVLAGISALAHFPDARAVEPLCRFIESGVKVLVYAAMSRLEEMGDDRAVPTLVKVLLDTRNSFNQRVAGGALARCGPRGFEALAAALGHADPRVRLGAVVGLDVSGDARAGPLLDQMASDPDPRVRERARMRMGRFP